MPLFDTNIVIDALGETVRAPWATERIEHAAADGAALINHVVLAELAAGVTNPEYWRAVLQDWRIEIAALDVQTAVRAGAAHRLYRDRGGGRRTILADFLIGAHAVTLGTPLVTRDRSEFARYFPELTIIAPEEPLT